MHLELFLRFCRDLGAESSEIPEVAVRLFLESLPVGSSAQEFCAVGSLVPRLRCPLYFSRLLFKRGPNEFLFFPTESHPREVCKSITNRVQYDSLDGLPSCQSMDNLDSSGVMAALR